MGIADDDEVVCVGRYVWYGFLLMWCGIAGERVVVDRDGGNGWGKM